MPKDKSFGKPTTRRYTVAEKEQAVRLVRQARTEGREAGAITRVAQQLGFGVESVRSWVKDADRSDGTAGPDAQRVVALETENRELVGELRELRRANEILKRGGCRTNRVANGVDGCWLDTMVSVEVCCGRIAAGRVRRSARA